MVSKNKAISKLDELIDTGKELLTLPRKSSKYTDWKNDIPVVLENIYNKDKIKDYNKATSVFWGSTGNEPESYWDEIHRKGITKSISYLKSCKKEINDFWTDDVVEVDIKSSDTACIERIIENFHRVAHRFTNRHDNRNTIEIADEYDVQDLFGSLLRLYFDDIRDEEYTPSYAGGASRIDFLISELRVAVEVKMTRKTLADKKVGEELLIDAERYQKHPDCEQLICFVYDPEHHLKNPNGLISDLSKEYNGFPVRVYIVPKL